MVTDSKKSIKQAAALVYDKERGKAPQVVAKGKGAFAEKIIALANEHGIPLHEDADLTEFLNTLDFGEEIPLEMYQVVAEIFAYLYNSSKSKGSV